ncbi:uncharacterized protein P174DRAFT_416992 [Aspergillus novofumigatus IBT 16806]|uniref:Uncharacterized protein n=1 Tax=Aspergillus novofumigatus (strain IBT 16806) TaxID=1392255 RepID=A0A2I1CNT6_ASPN1|nr:uncharacterized protein P174DRAFT_416992 [Aspergillus novofumigatus IBT 16806]PKX99307.1 hypothetical protein P174DRAFT_416992 [Aspergillus novofumigatus IBT 16806]
MNTNEVKYRRTEAEWLGQYDSNVQYSRAQTQTALLSGDHSTMVAMCLYVAGKSKHVPLPLRPRVLPRKPKNEAENEERITRKCGIQNRIAKETAKISYFDDVHTAQATRKQPHLETRLAVGPFPRSLVHPSAFYAAVTITRQIPPPTTLATDSTVPRLDRLGQFAKRGDPEGDRSP